MVQGIVVMYRARKQVAYSTLMLTRKKIPFNLLNEDNIKEKCDADKMSGTKVGIFELPGQKGIILRIVFVVNLE